MGVSHSFVFAWTVFVQEGPETGDARTSGRRTELNRLAWTRSVEPRRLHSFTIFVKECILSRIAAFFHGGLHSFTKLVKERGSERTNSESASSFCLRMKLQSSTADHAEGGRRWLEALRRKEVSVWPDCRRCYS